LALGALLVLAGCSAPPARSAPAVPPVGSPAATLPESTADPYQGYVSTVYHGADNWVCSTTLPTDPCRPISGTVVGADGTAHSGDLKTAANPTIDCFYVYPTASRQSSINADRSIDAAVRAVVHTQAAPFSSVCRVFAPAYRQLTVHAIDMGVADVGTGEYRDQAAAELAYTDVLDAWRSYSVEQNQGRGVVLIGDSQGAFMLKRLLTEEIEPDARMHARLVSAILVGGAVLSGSLKSHPCAADNDVHCMVAYQPYPADQPPGPEGLFGHAGSPSRPVLCVNPAALAGGSGRATALAPPSWVGIKASTAFVTLPEALTMTCRTAGNYSYLAVEPPGHADRRPLAKWLADNLNPGWGYHGLDLALTEGNLLHVVAAQAKAYH
jgi:hypothetical protein